MCRDLKTFNKALRSGEYDILLPSGRYKAYCEMALAGGGYTFLSADIIAKLKKDDLKILFTDRNNVLLRISKPDGTQPYTHLEPLGEANYFTVQINAHIDQVKPYNSKLGPYLLFATTLPQTRKGPKSAFMSNGVKVMYTYCGPKPHWADQFAFFPNLDEIGPLSSSHNNTDVYEQGGVAVDWRATARRPYSTRRIPLKYFLLTEMLFAGCGCYTSSDRWLHAKYPALGTAIGIR